MMPGVNWADIKLTYVTGVYMAELEDHHQNHSEQG